MSKAILVMDMPDSCIECRFCREIDEGTEACCEIMDEPGDSSLCRMIEDYCQCIPNWCPLQNPQLKEEGSNCFNEFEDGYTQGCNDCIE